MSVRTPENIVEEYRERGYSDEKIRIIALSRPEGLRAKILEYMEAHPAEGDREGMVQQYLPVRRVDEDTGGAGAVPEEEPAELDEEPAEPMSVPDEAPMEEEAPVPLGRKGKRGRKARSKAAVSKKTKATRARKTEKEEEEEDVEEDRVLPVVAEVEEAEGGIEEEEVAAGATQEAPSVEIEELRRRLQEACIEAERAKQGQSRLVKKAETLAEEVADRDERLEALETREEELLRASEERDRLREDGDAQSVTVAALENALEQKEARLEEAAGIHADEMRRIIDAYEQRIRGVRAQGLKGNLIAFASAAAVLLVFLVSLASREHIDERLVPDTLTFNENLREETDEPAERFSPRQETVRHAEDRVADPVRQGMSVADGSTFVDQPQDRTFALREDAPVERAERAADVEGASSRDGGVIRYTVKKNDTLWDISERFLGAGKHWPKIENDNRLRSKKLKVGQKLVIRGVSAQ